MSMIQEGEEGGERDWGKGEIRIDGGLNSEKAKENDESTWRNLIQYIRAKGSNENVKKNKGKLVF